MRTRFRVTGRFNANYSQELACISEAVAAARARLPGAVGLPVQRYLVALGFATGASLSRCRFFQEVHILSLLDHYIFEAAPLVVELAQLCILIDSHCAVLFMGTMVCSTPFTRRPGRIAEGGRAGLLQVAFLCRSSLARRSGLQCFPVGRVYPFTKLARMLPRQWYSWPSSGQLYLIHPAPYCGLKLA